MKNPNQSYDAARLMSACIYQLAEAALLTEEAGNHAEANAIAEQARTVRTVYGIILLPIDDAPTTEVGRGRGEIIKQFENVFGW